MADYISTHTGAEIDAAVDAVSQKVDQANIVNDLTTGGATNVASAETVKTLKTQVDDASSTAVKLTGNQAINGTKTFQNNVNLNGGAVVPTTKVITIVDKAVNDTEAANLATVKDYALSDSNAGDGISYSSITKKLAVKLDAGLKFTTDTKSISYDFNSLALKSSTDLTDTIVVQTVDTNTYRRILLSTLRDSQTFTTKMFVPAGTEASPGVVDSSNVDTGLYFTADSVNLSVEGVNQVKVKTDEVSFKKDIKLGSATDYLKTSYVPGGMTVVAVVGGTPSANTFTFDAATNKWVFSGVTEVPTPTTTNGAANKSYVDVVYARRNNAGQVKVNFPTPVSAVNFTANTRKQFDINAFIGTATVSASPTTVFPVSSPSQDKFAVFDPARGTTPVVGRLIENPIPGQSHIWRIQCNFANKAANNTGSLSLVLRNPVSGFEYVAAIPLANGVTSGIFNIVMMTIADTVSINPPDGYILEAETSFTDATFTVNINSITRFSNAVEITTPVV